MALYLRENSTPLMEGKCFRCAAAHGDKMILPCLYRFPEMFLWWSSGGTIWYVMVVSLISCLYRVDTSLSRIFRFGTMPHSFMRKSARLRAWIVSPSVLLFIASAQIEPESTSTSTIMYFFPRLETTGSFPV